VLPFDFISHVEIERYIQPKNFCRQADVFIGIFRRTTFDIFFGSMDDKISETLTQPPNQSRGCVKTVLRKVGNDQFFDMGNVVKISRRIGWSENEFSHRLSPEPTAVGAGRSAVAVHVASRRWFSFLR
jgi:hypothetical protein